MTGYGTGAVTRDGVTATAEVRSVNNRYYEFAARLPKHLMHKENELKELVRSRVSRGKITLNLGIERGNAPAVAVQINPDAAKAYYGLLQELKTTLGVQADISLDTMLKFSDIFSTPEETTLDETEWAAACDAVTDAMTMLLEMRDNEGRALTTDLRARIAKMERTLGDIETLSHARADLERARLRERVGALLTTEKIDPQRLELEIVLMADKLDVTEEIVRFRSHLHFFLAAIDGQESEGRKISFLLQEMNREANTIGSKAYDAEIAHLVVNMKEEIERIREQIQNIE